MNRKELIELKEKLRKISEQLAEIEILVEQQLEKAPPEPPDR